MNTWTTDEVDRIGAADELQIASLDSHGALRPYTTIWVVRLGGDLYVRSVRGRAGAWFRHAVQTGEGRIRAGGVERDVAFAEPEDADHAAIDRAYRSKYARYGHSYVDPTVTAEAAAATLRLTPR